LANNFKLGHPHAHRVDGKCPVCRQTLQLYGHGIKLKIPAHGKPDNAGELCPGGGSSAEAQA